MKTNKENGQYEVLSPWAEVNPILLKGIAPRVKDLAGKKIGLFDNPKRSARPMLTVVGEELKKRFPTSEISWYHNTQLGIKEIESENKAKYEEWIRGVDAVVAAVGD